VNLPVNTANFLSKNPNKRPLLGMLCGRLLYFHGLP